jgi:hypothetical protein
MHSVREIDSRLTILEISTEKDFHNLKEDLKELKDDTKSIKKAVMDTQAILNKREGSNNTIKMIAPYALTLLGIIASLIVIVGYEQRLEYERATSKRLNEIERFILSKGEVNGSN